MSSVTSEYLSAVKWAEESYSPVDFVANTQLPQVGKVIKGQIQGQQIGVPTAATPSLNQTIFWLKVAKKTRVMAQCVKFKEIRGSPVQRAVVTGPRLEISEDYQGWFEILSEDGRSARSIDSVVELVKRFPRRVLVREAIKVLTGKKNTTGDFLSEKTRVIQVGEVLQLDSLASFTCKSANDKYLKCLTSSGEVIFMRLDQKGTFSPVAKEDSISGVHSIKSLALNKRLPLMVRLVHGSAPVASFKGFLPTLRIVHLIQEDCLLGMPMLKDCDTLLELPLTSPTIRLVPPCNTPFLLSLNQYTSLLDLANRAMPGEKSIQVSPSVSLPHLPPPPHPCHSSPSSSSSPPHLHPPPPPHASVGGVSGTQLCDLKQQQNQRQQQQSCNKIYEQHRRRFSPFVTSNSGLVRRHLNQITCDKFGPVRENPLYDSSLSLNLEEPSENAEYDEIDQIYDYIRGFAPLPESIRRELNLPPPLPPPNASSNVTNRFIRYSFLHPDHRRLSYPAATRDKSTTSPGNTVTSKQDTLTTKESNNIYSNVVKCKQLDFHQLQQQLHRSTHQSSNSNSNSNNNSNNNNPQYHHQQQQQLSQQQQQQHQQQQQQQQQQQWSLLRHQRKPLRSNSVGKIFSGNLADDRSMRMSPSPFPGSHETHSTSKVHNNRPNHQLLNSTGHGTSPPWPTGSNEAVKSKLFLKRPPGKQSNIYGVVANGRAFPLLRFNSSRNLTLHSAPSPPPPVNHNHDQQQRKGSPTGSDRANNNIKGANNVNCSLSSGRSFLTSPIFNIRYKSLTNISFSPPPPPAPQNCKSNGQQHSSSSIVPSHNHNPVILTPGGGGEKYDALATLDSSQCSRQSSSSNCKLKVGKKLSKPKSLNNLLREIASAFSPSSSSSHHQRLDSPVNSLDSPVSSSSFPPSASSTTPADRANGAIVVTSRRCNNKSGSASCDSDFKSSCDHETRMAHSLSSGSNITDDPSDSCGDGQASNSNDLKTSDNGDNGSSCCKFRSCGNLNNNLKNISLALNGPTNKLGTVYI